MTLSDFRTGRPPIENVGGATSTSAGYPPMTQTTFLTCRTHYPGGPNRCVSVFFPVRAAFPNYLVGRHPRRHFRGLLKLHSRYGLWRAFTPAVILFIALPEAKKCCYAHTGGARTAKN